MQLQERAGRKGTIAIATVFGDIHDIGKNIVKAMLENYGYKVIDLGKNVPAETVVKTVIENKIQLVGLSALMTTTVANMEETINQLHKALKENNLECKIVVGGAVLTPDYAKKSELTSMQRTQWKQYQQQRKFLENERRKPKIQVQN